MSKFYNHHFISLLSSTLLFSLLQTAECHFIIPFYNSFDAHALDLLDKMLILDPSKVYSDLEHHSLGPGWGSNLEKCV